MRPYHSGEKLFQLTIWGVERMSQASILEVGPSAFETNLASKNSHVNKVELQLVLSNSELGAAGEILEWIELRLRFAEDGVTAMCRKIQGQGHQLCDFEATLAPAESVLSRLNAIFNRLLYQSPLCVRKPSRWRQQVIENGWDFLYAWEPWS